MSQFNRRLRGAGGAPKTPAEPVNSPDNLRSEDTIEVVLGIAEGPVKGPVNGNKSIMINDTQLQRSDDGYNFDDVVVTIYPGEANPEKLKFALGGAADNTNVGVNLINGSPLTRQTQTGDIDAIDIRLVVSALYTNVTSGDNQGVFDNNFQFRIKFKPLSASVWTIWENTTLYNSTTNPYYVDYEPWTGNTSFSGGVYTNTVSGQTYTTTQANNQATWSATNGDTGSGLLNIKGKTTSTYVKEYRIPVPRIPEPYQIQIERISPDDTTNVVSTVAWESFQEIDLSPKAYPYTAALQLVGKSSDQFNSVPTISGVWDGMIIRVPVNYDPETWTYTGVWDGTWKYEWTNNPVWLLYEAITNDRWGWSAYTPISWSKYEAYELAQICDTILDNGLPKYTFNAYITEPLDGREFCRYIAGTFFGTIVDDNNGNVRVLMDKNDEATQLFGNQSIVGDFEYSYTDLSVRYNDITVSFNNEDIDYGTDRRPVQDPDKIDQNGRIPFDFVAVGCTNQAEAVRKATRKLVEANTETEMVKFTTNRRGAFVDIYEVILVSDQYRAQSFDMRISSIGGDRKSITLREPIYLETAVTYNIVIQGHNGLIERTLTNSVAGPVSVLTFASALGTDLDDNAQFALTQDGAGYGLPKPYRVLNIEENSDSADDIDITAMEINRLKYDAEDNSEIVGEPSYTFVKTGNPTPPTNVTATNLSRPAPDGTILYEARIDFTPADDRYVDGYDLRYKESSETEYTLGNLDDGGRTITLARQGTYVFEVRSRNVWQQYSGWVEANDGTPLDVEKLNGVFGGSIISAVGGLNHITVKVAYPDQSDIRYAQIWSNITNNSTTATMVGKIDSNSFTHNGLSGVTTRYYWAKFEDGLGQTGAFTAVASATTTQTTADDIGDGTIDISKLNGVDFGGIPSYPTAPGSGTEGDVYFNTTDGKLYRYHSGAWTAAVPTTDLTGTLTAGQIGTGIIDATKIASGLQTVEVLPALPTTGNTAGRMVFLTTDKKLYRYDGTAFIATTAATDLTGTLTSSQIADLDAAKLTGTIVAARIGSATIDASKIASNAALVETFVTNPTTGNFEGRMIYNSTDKKLYRYNGTTFIAAVAAGDLTGQIIASQIADGSISIAKVASGLTMPEIMATLPVTGNFQGRLVLLTTDNKLYRYTGSVFTAAVATVDLTGQITTTQITDGGITTPKIATGAVTATQIAANTITAAQIAANTITAGQIQAGAITATEIAAGAITASKMFITDNQNLVLDVDFSDLVYWNIAANHTVIASTTIQALFGTKNSLRAYGDGTTSTPTTLSGQEPTNGRMAVEPNKSYRFSFGYYYQTGNTSIVQGRIQWYDAGGSVISTISSNAPDHRTVAATATDTGIKTIMVTAPASASYCLFSLATYWSTTLVNPLNTSGVWFGAPRFSRAADGELIVDGSITAAKIVAGTITSNEIAANTITASNIAANTITAGQIAAGTIGAAQIAAGAIAASKIFVGDPSNMILDPNFADENAWQIAVGSSFDVGGGTVVTMGVPKSVFTPTGDGTKTQVSQRFAIIVPSQWPTVEPNKTYRVYAKTRVNSGFTGRLRIVADWYKSDGTASTVLSSTSVVGVDYRSVAASSVAISTIEDQVVSPSDAAYCRFSCFIDWSTTLNNASAAAMGGLRMNRANEGNLIVDGTITTSKIVANAITTALINTGAVTANELASNSVTAVKIVAGTITADKLQANSITAGQIAAGAIGATEIAANAIIASKIAVTDNQNLVLNTDFTDLTYWSKATAHVVDTNSTIQNLFGIVSSLRETGNGTTSQATSLTSGNSTYGKISVEPGKPYRLSFDYYHAAGNTSIIQGRISWYTAAGTSISTSSVNGPDFRVTAAASATTATKDAIFTAPTNAAFAYVGLAVFWSTTQNNTQNVWFGAPRLSRAVNGELIVDGTISASKILANTITANEIAAGTITATELAANSVTANAILAGTITAAKIASGTITATQIAAGTISADKMNVSNLAAISANLGAVTAGSLSINSKFIVDSSGNVTIRNATTGARLLISNTLISIYDASNVLRVRLGIW